MVNQAVRRWLVDRNNHFFVFVRTGSGGGYAWCLGQSDLCVRRSLSCGEPFEKKLMRSLVEIAQDHSPGSDKFNKGYMSIYERYLEPIREKDVVVLELGIWFGSSLRIWREYFQNARVVGIDSDFSKLRGDLEGIEVISGNYLDFRVIEQIIKDHGPFGVIVDDGAHHSNAQLYALKMLWPHLLPGGIYFIEDISLPEAALTESYLMGLSKNPQVDPGLPDCEEVNIFHTSEYQYSDIGVLVKCRGE